MNTYNQKSSPVMNAGPKSFIPKATVIADKQIVTTPDKKKNNSLLGSMLGVAKSIIPSVANTFIPGSGAVVKNLLTTLNDDEWFGKYTGNGASFNELLQVQTLGTDDGITVNRYDVLAAMAEIETGFNPSRGFLDSFMPSVLAYVRNKTNNVLVENTESYYIAFYNAIGLYSLYYHIEKKIKLALDTPANIPTCAVLNVDIQPKYINQLMGIRDGLKAYLQSSVKLPYALASYLRWRYGTTFLSSNTKKAGLISYVPHVVALTKEVSNGEFVNTGEYSPKLADGTFAADPITYYNTIINVVKTQLASTGRACADIAAAYSNHAIKYDVEDRHFDEKEFCLRTNYTSTQQTDIYDDIQLLMDSRLDMNAAIQAITLSTMDQPLPITDIKNSLTPFPVYAEDVFLDLSLIDEASLEALPFSACRLVTGTRHWYSIPVQTDESRDIYCGGGNSESNASGLLGIAACNSLELHLNRGYSMYSGTSDKPNYAINSAPLAFDRARITVSSLNSIQRAAILNLVRGEYAQKEKVDVHEDAKEVIKDLTKEDIKVEA